MVMKYVVEVASLEELKQEFLDSILRKRSEYQTGTETSHALSAFHNFWESVEITIKESVPTAEDILKIGRIKSWRVFVNGKYFSVTYAKTEAEALDNMARYGFRDVVVKEIIYKPTDVTSSGGWNQPANLPVDK